MMTAARTLLIVVLSPRCVGVQRASAGADGAARAGRRHGSAGARARLRRAPRRRRAQRAAAAARGGATRTDPDGRRDPFLNLLGTGIEQRSDAAQRRRAGRA